MYISIINSGYYYYQLFLASLFNLLLPLSWYPQLHNLGKVFTFLTLISFQASLPLSNFFPCQGLFVCILRLLFILVFALFHLKCTSWPLFSNFQHETPVCQPLFWAGSVWENTTQNGPGEQGGRHSPLSLNTMYWKIR